MTLPTPRMVLKTISSKNQSLQDILKTLSLATSIVSVEPHVGGIHNTKMILSVDLGSGYPANKRYQQRVQFYNRLKLVDIIPVGAVYSTTDIAAAIATLNTEYGCDFTTDDVELVGGTLQTKETSLGYYRPIIVPSSCACVMDSQAFGIEPIEIGSAYWDWINDEQVTGVTAWIVKLLVNGTVYQKTVGASPQIGSVVSDIVTENNLGTQMEVILNDDNEFRTMGFRNLTSVCGSIGLEAVPVIDGIEQRSLIRIADTELCPTGESSLTCELAPQSVATTLVTIPTPVGTYELIINGTSVTMHTDQFEGMDLSSGTVGLLYALQYMVIIKGFKGYVNVSDTSGGTIENNTRGCVRVQLIHKDLEEQLLDVLLSGYV